MCRYEGLMRGSAKRRDQRPLRLGVEGSFRLVDERNGRSRRGEFKLDNEDSQLRKSVALASENGRWAFMAQRQLELAKQIFGVCGSRFDVEGAGEHVRNQPTKAAVEALQEPGHRGSCN